VAVKKTSMSCKIWKSSCRFWAVEKAENRFGGTTIASEKN